MSRVDRLTNERVPIRPEPRADEEPYKWGFNTPMMISPHDPSTLLMAANRLFKSTDRGQSWTPISPDLTSKVPASELSVMGVPLDKIKMGSRAPAWGTLFTFTESPRRAGVFYTGADDGTVQVSRDGGATWTNVTVNLRGLPPRTWVSKLEASRFADGRAYASFAGHRQDDFTPHIYVTDDFGASWRRITNGIPDGQVVHVVREDRRNGDVLYAGTEFGLFLSVNRGESWLRLRSNLPTVPIYDIAIHPRDNDLILGTFGRGVWILDDLTPVQQAAPAMTQTAHLFDMRLARQFNRAHDRWWMWGDRRFWGENPREGASIAFLVSSAARDLSLTIRDASQRVVRVLGKEEIGDVRPGRITRTFWDLRYDPLPAPASQRRTFTVPPFFTGAQKRAHSYQQVRRTELNPLSAPFVLPGDYTVTLSVDGRDVATRPVRVEGDPLVRITGAERQTWHDAAREAHELQRVAYEIGDRFAAISEQAGAIEKAAAGTTLPPDAAAKVEAFSKRMTALRRQLSLPAPGSLGGDAALRLTNYPGQLASLKGQLIGATAVPTAMQRMKMTESRTGLAKAVAEANEVLATDLPAAIALLRQHSVTLPALNPIAPLPGVSQP
jgi:photosystem II stability/assembly factor-like uncharacterized protein